VGKRRVAVTFFPFALRGGGYKSLTTKLLFVFCAFSAFITAFP
jgi:hypothetical protein